MTVGRPPKPPEQRRTRELCRVNEAERASIGAAAARRGLSVPDYVLALHAASVAPREVALLAPAHGGLSPPRGEGVKG